MSWNSKCLLAAVGVGGFGLLGYCLGTQRSAERCGSVAATDAPGPIRVSAQGSTETPLPNSLLFSRLPGRTRLRLTEPSGENPPASELTEAPRASLP